ncbi:glycoside hydrolase family 76 protein [Bacteroides clarus]|uniref:glycoside hydrolase family 76 protein n=1 Tax=Bacteroides clarus TaxID=626929 RepID=UPI001897DEBB|nr:glycoside hydrolase family 76 protein [Bacteroides clarus]
MISKRILFSLLVSVIIVGCTIEKQVDSGNELALMRAKQTLDSLYLNYSIPGTHLLQENCLSNISDPVITDWISGRVPNMPRQYSYLWPYSGTFSAVNALFAATQDTTYKIILDHQVLVGLEEYFDDERKPAGYASYVRNLRQSDRFYDDNIWLGINFVSAYLLTQENKYLQRALLIWDFIKSGTDNKLGGGTYWCEETKDSKNTCSNAPGVVLALKLFQATQDSTYLTEGEERYKWTKTHLQDSADYLYFDNIKLDGEIDKTKYAYNSGQMMQAAALLYQLTDKQEYLLEAQNIARGCYDYFFINHTMEHGKTFKLLKKGDVWFTAVMLRGFIELYRVDNNEIYLNSFNESLDYAWKYARDAKGLFNTDFSGKSQDSKRWLLTQAAMVEMYALLATIK